MRVCACLCVCVCVYSQDSFFILQSVNTECAGVWWNGFSCVTVSNSSGRLCLFTWEGGMEREGERERLQIKVPVQKKKTKCDYASHHFLVACHGTTFCMFTISLFAQGTKASE